MNFCRQTVITNIQMNTQIKEIYAKCGELKWTFNILKINA